MSGGGRLVLLRHGRTEWSATGRITGWEDPPLDDGGEAEARWAGALVASRGIRPAAVFTSCARRARRTAELVLETALGHGASVRADWRLNERHFGQLQGLDRHGARELLGRDWVRACSADPRLVPPEIPRTDRRHPVHDRAYRHVDRSRLPGGESLEQLDGRVLECWREVLEPTVRSGADVLVVGHCHALRALARHLGAGARGGQPFARTGSGLVVVGGSRPAALDDEAPDRHGSPDPPTSAPRQPAG